MKTKKTSRAKARKPVAKPKTSKEAKKKMIAVSLAAVTAGIVGYFGWQYLKRHKTKNASTNADIDAVLRQSNNLLQLPVSTQPVFVDTTNSTKTTPAYSISTPKSDSNSDGFPLQKGSKGDLVKQLQTALIARYGKSILPRYGADGDYGSETINALKKLGFPSSVNQSTFNVITAATKVDSRTVGKELYQAAVVKDYNTALNKLRKLKSTEDYSKANEVFKSNLLKSPGQDKAVRQTIVNGLLNTFSAAYQKDEISNELIRIGLQFDGNKWALSGLNGVSLITTEPTTIWANAKESVKVPAQMVLGNEISRRLDYTLFENKGKYFLVNTKSVQYL